MPKRSSRRKSNGARLIAPALCFVRLAANEAADNGGSWIQVAYQGAWKGYVRGEFELTADDLAVMVANFRRHPSYKPGVAKASADDLATCAFDVIPFDWRHASTAPAGASPLEMQVAQAWACELEVRPGEGGKAELWTYVRYLEPMATFVAEGKVHWTSITAEPHFTDPVTGEDRGWYVQAIAFTNDPFLQGMSVAADRKEASAPKQLYRGFDPYSPPSSPTEVLECLRDLFELPATSELGAVLAEIAKLKIWSAGGGAPPGVDVDELVGAMRQIFNLPTLADPADVFAAADSLLAALASAASTGGQASAELSKESRAMDPKLKKILEKLLAAGVKLGRASTDEDAIEAILEAFATQKVVLDAGAGATAGLSAVLTALGVEDVAGATKKIAEMFKSVDQLEKAMPELKSLRDSQAESEDAAAEKDVGEAMAAHRMPDAAKPAMMFTRTGGLPKTDLVGRTAARAKFFEQYPAVDPKALALTRPAYSNPSSGSTVPVLGSGAPPRLEAARAIGGAELVDLSRYEGNRFERAIAHIEATDPRVKKYTRPEKFHAARRLLASGTVVGAD